ncbi:membrane-spanning 4-domains subfamily A member 8 isoform X2 [Kryptolebias marmoratus]|uniref:membrane-spanning 4-domains subfamily A member 8 isoform X2 n=1 Tax=Kryptolebias marmoratus TaxID=37003 RepID=UPI0007F9027F|nr:membrane-spanning 4-domains subfamily A member 8 isoform X2 [Kryptolebias marmoratus]XP_024866804.1 membrane-spanning 4-domains subfamily A member 8 isoform X2 [Kryptolebias marmoratus]
MASCVSGPEEPLLQPDVLLGVPEPEEDPGNVSVCPRGDSPDAVFYLALIGIQTEDSLQIVIGLLNIGLGAILHLSRSASLYIIWSLQCPYWLGALFIIFGIMCILSERYPSPCTVILNVTLNLAGVAFAITAITLYSASVANIHLWWYYCEEPYYGTTPSPSLQDEYRRNACLTSKKLVLMLLRSIHGVLIVFSVLELCVVISCVVLGIKALKSSNKEKNKSFSDPEQFKPLLEEVSTNSAA